ncbi:MAG: matrixin family metalloprotease [Candidatus Thiodiazotropha sp. (ex Dulcina madagascariensis)]|nr:matrixin family metalloprotease [Candidatus Thiodiazotropha sp. (ex Dulcina madagascariensis)]
MRQEIRIVVRNVAIVLAIVAVGLLWSSPGYAFLHWWECDGEPITWDSNPDRLRASDDSFPPGNAFRAALGNVVDRFNRNPSNFNFDLRYDERRVRVGGAQSEVWFTDDPDLHYGYAAMTYPVATCRELRTMDIVFNVNEVWTSGTDQAANEKYGGSAMSFQTVAMHELGHAMGLNHEGDEYNVMGRGREHVHANCSQARAYLGEDASDGAVHLYGANPAAGEDVGVVHWKWLSRVEFGDADFSDHTRTRIHPVSEPIIVWYEDDEPNYLLRNGQTIDVEFTFENNGGSRQAYVAVGFYLSSNDCITDWFDRRIGGFAADLV